MRKLHLICNAHLDPIWQWNWEEGAAAALSTFRSAADLCEEFDYIFCHNEVVLYKYIEEYDSALFDRIKKLVGEGKWHIMGGWYLQPDCNMPCGESFVRQIQTGKEYFKKKFGVEPKTAINFDPFGHSRGLVQIIKKCGQDSYIVCRPYPYQCRLESNLFIWKGYDGSEIKCYRADSYNSPLGNAVCVIKSKAENQKCEDVSLILWGVGNHGGGPSHKDLSDIEAMIKRSGTEIIHSTPEKYFAEAKPAVIFDKSLLACMPGCYTSMIGLKQKHIELENELYLTEKMFSVASLEKLADYPQKEFIEAEEDLLNSEFHDVLPGSSVRSGEQNGIMLINHGLMILNKLKAKAFFSLLKNEAPAEENCYPFFVFNPNPYVFKTVVESEFSLADQNWADETSIIEVYDKGRRLLSQTVKEESNINLDWRKKFAFECKLKPMSLNRFDVKIRKLPKTAKKSAEGDIVFEKGGKYVRICRETGLILNYRIEGREYAKGSLFEPFLFKDNADPWAMGDKQLECLGTDGQPFGLMKEPYGIFKGLKPIEIIEDGDIYLQTESFFEKDSTKIRISYKIYKNSGDIDVFADVFWGETDKMLKLLLPVAVKGTYIGQTAYGCEPLFEDGRECVSQRFAAVEEKDKNCFAVINDCIYGSSFKDGIISLSLLRGAAYCAHPILDRQILPDDRYIKHFDQGERNYSFRITVCKKNELERLSSEFNQKPYTLNAFPKGRGNDGKTCVKISNKNIVLEAFKKSRQKDGYILRLFNNSEDNETAELKIKDKKISLDFKAYQVITLLLTEKRLAETEEMYI